MNMTQVSSTNLRAVGYDYSSRTLRVEFLSSGVYDYYGVDPALFEQLLLPNPWRRVGKLVKAHAYRRIAA